MARVSGALLVSWCAAWCASALVPPAASHPRRPSLRRRAADDDFDVDMLILETEEGMAKSLAALQSNLGALRARAASRAGAASDARAGAASDARPRAQARAARTPRSSSA